MKHLVPASFILGILLVFAAGCATTPPITSPEVTLKIVPERDLARHGVPFSNDPFLSPFTLITARDEFVTVSVMTALPQQARLIVSGDVEDADGKTIARLYSKDELRQYWLDHARQSDPNTVKLLGYLDQFYVPNPDVPARAGRYEYYVVLIGKSPIPRPAKAILDVSLGGAAAQQFVLDLPPLKK